VAFQPRTYKQQIRIPLFDGGLNTKYTDVSMPLNQSPDLQNVVFDDYGAVATTQGFQKVNATGIASSAIEGLHSYVKNSGERTLLAVCDRSLYSESGGVFSQVTGSTNVYTAGVDVKIVTVNDYAYLSDGYANPYKYNGGELTTIGVPAPTIGEASAASTGAGVLTGSYRYALTGINASGNEGEYALITPTAVSASSGQLTLTGIPVSPASAGVDSKYLYRNTSTVGGIYYRVTALTANQTSYVDNNADANLVTLMPADNGTMPKCKYMVEYRGRVYAAGELANPMRLYYSDALEPETWKSTNFVDIGDGDGFPISGITAYGNSIVIHKNDGRGQGSIWLLYVADSTGTADSSNWYLTKSPSAYGTQSDKAMDFFNNVLFFLNKSGGYAFAGTDIAESASQGSSGKFAVDSHTFDIEPDVLAFKNSYIHKAAAINFENKIYLAAPYGSQASGNNRVYIYDYVRASAQDKNNGAWSYMDGVEANNFTIHEGDLLFGSANDDGLIYKMTNEYNYDDSAIDSYYWTASISGIEEHRDFTKVFRQLFITVSCTGDWDMNLSYKMDFRDTGDTLTTVDLDGGGSLWGTSVLGTSTWGGSLQKKKVRVTLVNAVGKSIQFKFATNTADQWFKVHEIELLYNLRSMR